MVAQRAIELRDVNLPEFFGEPQIGGGLGFRCAQLIEAVPHLVQPGAFADPIAHRTEELAPAGKQGHGTSGAGETDYTGCKGIVSRVEDGAKLLEVSCVAGKRRALGEPVWEMLRHGLYATSRVALLRIKPHIMPSFLSLGI